MRTLLERAKWLYRNEEGATMVEYALMVALIAVVCITIVTALGGHVESKFTEADTALQ